MFIKTLLLTLSLFTALQATNLSNYINKQNCDQIIDKQVYTICYDYKMKGAKYVAYTLDGSKVNAVNIKKRGKFYTEKNLPKKYRSYSKDYVHSAYDRGYLVPAHFIFSKYGQEKSFKMHVVKT